MNCEKLTKMHKKHLKLGKNRKKSVKNGENRSPNIPQRQENGAKSEDFTPNSGAAGRT